MLLENSYQECQINFYKQVLNKADGFILLSDYYKFGTGTLYLKRDRLTRWERVGQYYVWTGLDLEHGKPDFNILKLSLNF
jgi:hypothetical protein